MSLFLTNGGASLVLASGGVPMRYTPSFLIIGDSIAEGRGTNNQTYTHASLGATVFRQDDVWTQANDPVDTGGTGSQWPLLVTHLLASRGVPVRLITVGTGSTDVYGAGVDQWDPSSGASWAEAVQQVSQSGVGGVDAVLAHLGPNASVNASTPTRANYNLAIDELATACAALSGSPPLFVGICGEVSTGSPPDRRAALDNIRAAILDAVSDNVLVRLGPNLIDQDYADGVHPASNAELQVVADRWWLALEHGLYGGANGRGPRLVSAVRTGTSVVVTVDRDLAAGTTYGGFRVEDNGSPVSVTSTTRSGTRTITVTLAATPSGTVTLTFGGENDASGQTVPTSTAITLPDTRSAVLPMEPCLRAPVTGDS